MAADAERTLTHLSSASRAAASKAAKWPPESFNSAGGWRSREARGLTGGRGRPPPAAMLGVAGRAVPGAGPRRGRAVLPRSPDGGEGTCSQALTATGCGGRGSSAGAFAGSGSAGQLPAVSPHSPRLSRCPPRPEGPGSRQGAVPALPAQCETPRSCGLPPPTSRYCCPASPSRCRPAAPEPAPPAGITPFFPLVATPHAAPALAFLCSSAFG